MSRPKVVVIGAGAAGITAAIFAARGGAEVVVLDASAKPGTKILISGGGRCNVLPGEFNPKAFYSSGSANVLKRLFKTWPHAAVRSFFEDDLGVGLVLESESGKLFPQANRAKAVHDALFGAAETLGVTLRKSWRVARIESSDGFRIHNQRGDVVTADRIIVAAGGRSVPKTGSDGSGYKLAQQLGHELIPTYPALVPLTTAEGWWTELAGLSVPVQWSAWHQQKRKAEATNQLLFTHFGFSGPAALDASHWYAREACRIQVAWKGWSRERWEQILRGSKKTIGAAMVGRLPKRLSAAILQDCQIDAEQNLAQFRKDDRNRLLNALTAWELPLTGTRGYDYAEVTGGGVPLADVDPSTLQSRRTPGAFFCGEILDVIGDIGGHNFLWAWVTGKLAGTQALRGLN